MTVVVAAVALNTRAIGKGITLFLIALIMAGVLVAVNKKISSLKTQG